MSYSILTQDMIHEFEILTPGMLKAIATPDFKGTGELGVPVSIHTSLFSLTHPLLWALKVLPDVELFPETQFTYKEYFRAIGAILIEKLLDNVECPVSDISDIDYQTACYAPQIENQKIYKKFLEDGENLLASMVCIRTMHRSLYQLMLASDEHNLLSEETYDYLEILTNQLLKFMLKLEMLAIDERISKCFTPKVFIGDLFNGFPEAHYCVYTGMITTKSLHSYISDETIIKFDFGFESFDNVEDPEQSVICNTYQLTAEYEAELLCLDVNIPGDQGGHVQWHNKPIFTEVISHKEWLDYLKTFEDPNSKWRLLVLDASTDPAMVSSNLFGIDPSAEITAAYAEIPERQAKAGWRQGPNGLLYRKVEKSDSGLLVYPEAF